MIFINMIFPHLHLHHYRCGQDATVGRNTCCSSGATRDDFADVDSLKHFHLENDHGDEGDEDDDDDGDEDFAEVDSLKHFHSDALINHNGCDDDDDGGKRRKGHQIWKRLSLKGISLPL